jgi:hypothetical protein
MLAILGFDGVTVKLIPLLGVPPTVTTTLPVVAPDGTMATILVSLQLEIPACEPLKAAVLACCTAPNPVPEIVTSVLTPPEVGFSPMTLGAPAVIVIVEVADLVGSTIDVAVTVTVGGLGTAEGGM